LSKDGKRKADFIVVDGILLTLSPKMEVVPQGAIAISEGRIAGLGPKDNITGLFEAPKTLNAGGGLVMPGLVNGHNHAAMTCFRGMADDLPLMEWLTKYIFPSPHYGLLDKGFEFTERLIRDWQGDSLIKIAVEPHALYTCSPDLLRRCREISDRYGVPWIIHLAETRSELEEVSRKYGTTPVKHLQNLGLLSSSLIACHCVWLTEEEMDLLARNGVRIVHNPESNMKLASGVAPVPDLLSRGIPVGLGTDGCASNNNLDLFQEMDFAAKLHKVHRLDPTVMPAQTVLEMATLGGARVLGLEEEIGSLEVGKKADIIILDLNRPHLQPVYNIVSHLVYAATGADVRDVIIDGKLVMENRKLLTLDEKTILSKMEEIKTKILHRVSP
jgi:5-methylthioadenosine/S-adenosylhomocysteine deaminase